MLSLSRTVRGFVVKLSLTTRFRCVLTMVWDGVRFLEFEGRGKGLGPSVRLLKEITWRAVIKPHCSRIRRLRMMVFKNDPYLTCTPPYKLVTTAADDTFSLRFNDGLGWVLEFWGRGKDP